LGRLPDFSALSLDFTISSEDPAVLATQFAEPEWVPRAREIKAFSLAGHLAGDGPDGISVTKGNVQLGMGDALDLSVSGSLKDLVQGQGLDADVVLKSRSPNRLLHRLGFDVPPIQSASAEAKLRGSLAALRVQEVESRVQLDSKVVLGAKGDFLLGTSEQSGAVSLSLNAGALEGIAESLQDTPGEIGTRVSTALSETAQKAAVTHVLSMGPVEVSAEVKWASGVWSLEDLKGEVGSDSGEWLRVSGNAPSLWPAQSGLKVRLDSRIENPPLGFSGREALLNHLDSVRVGLTWNMDEASRASLDDLEIQVDVTGDLSLSVNGHIEIKEETLYGAKGTLSVKADSLAEFNGLVGRPLPPWSPFALEARFDGTANEWKLDDVVLGLGRAQLKGDADWRRGTAVPHFGLRLEVDKLSLPRASRAFRLEAPKPPEETQTASGADSDAASDADSKVDWSWLSTTEADVALSAGQIVLGENWVGQDMLLKVAWGGGVLRGPSLDLHWPQGGVEVRGHVDAQKEVPSLALGVAAHGLDMQSIVGWMGQPRALSGQAELVLDLRTQGDPRKALIAGLDGTALLHVNHGTVLDRYANALQLGFERGSGSGDEQAMNCLIASLESTRGVVSTHALLWDTPVKLVRGLGVLNLNTDHLDLLLRPHLKRTIARSVTAAIRVEGPLEDLRIRPEPLQTVTDLARGLIGRTLRIVDHVSPQLGRAVLGIGSTTGSMVASTGLDVPSALNFLESPETCESVLASKEVKELEAFRPADTIAN
ncbi:MAG: AsmA-like C-terminal region-containing protein, partial [Myxococcota bacterium]|nr:AsmA-like C-terminal region-containing protein [Myxococcota bacterium]